MHWYDGILKITVHDEVSVGQPNVFVVVNGVEIIESDVGKIGKLQPRIVPLLL
jgi:hypothetical protein